jgi:hypothetical protein
MNRLQGSRRFGVSEGIRNTLDYPLVESYARDIEFASIHPDVALVGDGVILPGYGRADPSIQGREPESSKCKGDQDL